MIKIEDIKKIRKAKNLTQKQLAKLSNVSQSLIAKLESGLIDPSYSNVKKIIEALEKIDNTKKAYEIMTKKIISVAPESTIKSAIEKMRKNNISQLPVIDNNNNIVGLITESSIISAFERSRQCNTVKEIMLQPPPLFPKDSPVNLIQEALVHFPLAIITDKGIAKGIVTKSDLLDLYR